MLKCFIYISKPYGYPWGVVAFQHPWSLGGGGASDLKIHIESSNEVTLKTESYEIGRTTHTGEDDVCVLQDSGVPGKILFVHDVLLAFARFVELNLSNSQELKMTSIDAKKPCQRWQGFFVCFIQYFTSSHLLAYHPSEDLQVFPQVCH